MGERWFDLGCTKSLGTKNRGEAAIREERRLDALLLYEDFSTGLRAQRLLEEVVNSMKVEVDSQAQLWRFELLHEPALLELAADKAAQADIVFLSTHGQNDVPAAVYAWFRRWLARKSSEPRALVVLLDPGSRNGAVADRMLEALRADAVPAGVEVFVQAAETPRAEWESAMQNIRWPGRDADTGAR